MPVYYYKAKKSTKEIIEGEITANNVGEVSTKLDTLGLFPISINEKKETSKIPQKVSLRDLAEFTHQLSTLLTSGLSLLGSLETIVAQKKHKKIKPLLLTIISQIKEGKDFSSTLQKYPSIFSGFYISLIKVGETSGTLSENVSRLAAFLEEEQDFKSNVAVIITYPLLIAILGTLTVFVLLKFIVPKIVSIFEEIGQTLPLSTMVLITISDIISRYWLAAVAGGIALFFLLKNILKQPYYKLKVDRLKIRIPLWGELSKKVEMGNMSRTLSLLLRGGLPILEAMDILIPTVSNLEFRQKLLDTKENIKEGVSLSQALSKSDIFDEAFLNVVSVGEKSGKLPSVLEKLSYDFQKDINRNTKIMITLLEPLLILALGFIVALIVISMLLPIFQIEFNM